jgi:ribosomal subunit interface protein
MIERLEITGKHVELSDDLKKYVIKKISKLDRYIPKHARESVHAEIKLMHTKSSDKKQYTCEVIMHLPKEIVTAKDSTLNMFAAVDIVERKLKVQLLKYKQLHQRSSKIRTILKKVRHRNTGK